jgi:uncharacterized protein (DUF2236 family)
LNEAVAEIAEWFKAYQKSMDMLPITQAHIQAYVQKAKDLGVSWTR